jgi:hypothetical protein
MTWKESLASFSSPLNRLPTFTFDDAGNNFDDKIKYLHKVKMTLSAKIPKKFREAFEVFLCLCSKIRPGSNESMLN